MNCAFSGEREPYNTVKIPQTPRFRGPSIRNFTRFCYRALAGAGLLLVVLFAAGVLWLRYVTLPNVESWRPQLIASIESASGMAVFPPLSCPYQAMRDAARQGSAAPGPDLPQRLQLRVDPRRLRPVVGAEFPLEQANEAHALIASWQSTGKVVLVP